MIVHARAVDAWLENHQPRTSSEVVRLFERAARALWQRSSLTIGEAALMSMTSSALRKARRRHASLECVTVELSGIRCDHEFAAKAEVQEVRSAVRCLLIELLTLIGSLNAQILTPALHRELDSIAPSRERAVARHERRRDQSRST